MAGRPASSWHRRFRRTLVGALLWRALCYEPQFSGRARRRDFLLVFATSILAFLLLAPLAIFNRTPFALLDFVALVALTGLPILAAMVRRLHDINRYATALFIGFFPYIGWAILGIFMLIEGAEQDNIFGPNPRG